MRCIVTPLAWIPGLFVMVNKKRTQNLAPLMIMGTVLTIAPNFLLGLFRLPATDEPSTGSDQAKSLKSVVKRSKRNSF